MIDSDVENVRKINKYRDRILDIIDHPDYCYTRVDLEEMIEAIITKIITEIEADYKTNSVTMKTFYKELLKQGKTIKWLAEEIGVTHQTVYAWKQGKAMPKPAHLYKMAEVLKINNYLLVEEHYHNNLPFKGHAKAL